MNFNQIFFALVVGGLFLLSSCTVEDLIAPSPEPTTENKPETLELSIEPSTGKTVKVLQPEQTSDGIFVFTNSGDATLNILFEHVADADGTLRTIDRPMDPGASFSIEMEDVVGIFCEVLPFPADPVNPSLDFVGTYTPSDPGTIFGPSDWLDAGPVCIEGSADVAPDSDGACLWESDVIWESVAARDIELEINVTGDQDLKVEIEYSGNIFQSYSVSAPPALPQFQTLQGEWEDVVAVHVTVEKSPVNDCSNGKYDFHLCYN